MLSCKINISYLLIDSNKYSIALNYQVIIEGYFTILLETSLYLYQKEENFNLE